MGIENICIENSEAMMYWQWDTKNDVVVIVNFELRKTYLRDMITAAFLEPDVGVNFRWRDCR